jgi:hypothetical protein
MSHIPSLPTLVLLAAMMGAAHPAWSADASAYAQAEAQFQHAREGDKNAVEPAAKLWAEQAAAHPADPVAKAYAGAATALQATTTLLPWRKMGYAEDGLALIDKALAMLTPAHDTALYRGVPVSLETRFVAASTFLGLPGMFNRSARGAKLLSEVLNSPLMNQAPLGFQAAVWMVAANEAHKAQRQEDANARWQKVVASGAPQAPAAQAQLKGL